MFLIDLSVLFQRVEPDINVKRECEEKIVHVDINIPDVLKKKLEDDCFYINKRKKVQTTEARASFPPASETDSTSLPGFN